MYKCEFNHKIIADVLAQIPKDFVPFACGTELAFPKNWSIFIQIKNPRFQASLLKKTNLAHKALLLEQKQNQWNKFSITMIKHLWY